MQFRNPQYGHIETVSPLTWLWCLVFGAFYFPFKVSRHESAPTVRQT